MWAEVRHCASVEHDGFSGGGLVKAQMNVQAWVFSKALALRFQCYWYHKRHQWPDFGGQSWHCQLAESVPPAHWLNQASFGRPFACLAHTVHAERKLYFQVWLVFAIAQTIEPNLAPKFFPFCFGGNERWRSRTALPIIDTESELRVTTLPVQSALLVCRSFIKKLFVY